MEMEYKYANEKNALMLVALLKAHGIKRVIVSPGTTDICLIVSMMHDGSFEMYSCIDERSAAYMACGIAAETGEPVVIMCTEATASRDYLPGLTEAYHRKLPILAITGMHSYTSIGHLEPQVIDRSISPVDSFRLKVNLPILKDAEDEWDSMIKINRAILELKRHGGGPVHINLPWPSVSYNFSVSALPDVRVIKRYYVSDDFPQIPDGKVVIFIGSHIKWDQGAMDLIDGFCAEHDSVVFCDHSSKFYGEYAIHANIFAAQPFDWDVFDNIKLVIHVGEEAADQHTMSRLKKAETTWRVNPDGEIRDAFRNLSKVFEMSEKEFFRHYITGKNEKKDSFFKECLKCKHAVRASLPELPFSNFYVASKIAEHLPDKSTVHIGASNSIRVWSMFDFPEGTFADSNMGCRGIDGAVSTSIGISLAHPDKIVYCILGDLTFFYDMSALGNRHVGDNYRILIINNGGGNIFKQRGALGYRIGDCNSDLYISAGGHFGDQSPVVVKQYAEALGYRYLSARSIEEFDEVYWEFLNPEITGKMVFEVFVSDENERIAFDRMFHTVMDQKSGLKEYAKKLVGKKGTTMIKELLKR